MSERVEMLDRIRKALRRDTPADATLKDFGPQLPKLDPVMPPIAPEECVARFETELEKVSGSAHRASTPSELEEILWTIIEKSQATGVVITRNRLLADIRLAEKLRGRVNTVAIWPESLGGASGTDNEKAFREQCFLAGIGISGVDFVLAETGSLVLSSETEGSQLASLSPPIHVALYRREQVLSSLDEILERLPVSASAGLTTAGRSTVFITGPSRTADIEQILIRGVHGPGEVHAILVEESCVAEMRALKK
ncbi:MAG: LutC/YkgG family protein [Terriglobia bacterium]